MSGVPRKIGHTGNLPRKSPRIYHPHFKNPENEGEAGSSYCTIKILQLEDDIKRQQNEIEGLRIHNESLRNKVKELNSLLDQENRKRGNKRLADEIESSKIGLNKMKNENKDLKASNEKLEQQMLQKSEELATLKNSYGAQVRLQEQKLLDSMEQFKILLQNEVKNSAFTLLESNLSKMESEMLSKCSQLTKQIEELESQTKGLIKEIDKERDCHSHHTQKQIDELRSQTRDLIKEIDKEKDHKAQHARRLDEMKRELINKKEMILAELKAKVEKDIIARMDKYSTRMQSVISIIVYASGVLKKENAKKLEDEEESYKFTNAFTSAGEGSVLDISKRYRHLQHNMRASAVRASKKVYKVPAKSFFCSQTLNAYEVAKNVLLEESGKCVYMNLIKLQPSGEEFNDKMLKACMRIVDHIATDEVAKDAVQRITEELRSKDAEERAETAKNDSLPQDVADYYHTLAELTWQAISRPIPMVYEMEEQKYKKDYHDLKDGESDDEGRPIVYVYPVLYSSNQWPRQIAQMGRVELATEE